MLTIRCNPNSPNRLKGFKKRLMRLRPQLNRWPNNRLCCSNNSLNNSNKSSKRERLLNRESNKPRLKKVSKHLNFNK